MLPPTLSCDVWTIFTPRSPKRRASWRWTMVAPTCDLMSSPTIGRFAFLKRLDQYSSRAMNTGMQFTKPQPASRICSTYHLVACSEPTGRYETTTSVLVSLRISTMSTVEPGAFVIFWERYLPRPSCVMPHDGLGKYLSQKI